MWMDVRADCGKRMGSSTFVPKPQKGLVSAALQWKSRVTVVVSEVQSTLYLGTWEEFDD